MSADRAGPGQRPEGLAGRLRDHLDRTGLIPTGAPVTVALSGGLDSVVLLHLLRFPLHDRTGRLAGAHLDHGMRPDSGADAGWVEGLGRAWGVPVASGRAPRPLRSEAEARQARYAFLEEAAPTGDLIATAHHADDQAETLIFRLARGTGLHGLRGIAPRWGRVVRPLLPFTRAELEAYADRERLPFRSDPTNRQLRFARNRIRHRVLPELERLSPGVARRLADLAVEVRRSEAAWDQALAALEEGLLLETREGSLTLARQQFCAYHPVLRARLLRRLLRRFGDPPGRAGTQAALEFIISGPSGGGLDLAAGVRLERDFDRIRVVAGEPGGVSDRNDQALEIGPGAGSGRAVIGGHAYQVWWGSLPGQGWSERASVEAPRHPLVLRGWRSGDRIRLAYGTKKLKKLLGERRLDRRERAQVPVLVDGRGEVLWVVGVARADGVGDGASGFQIAVGDAGDA